MSDNAGNSVQTEPIKYGLDMFQVTQGGFTQVIYDVKVFSDKTYSIEETPEKSDYKLHKVVVLANPHNDEIWFQADEPASLNFISNGMCYSMEGCFSSKDIFNAIYEEKFKRCK